MWPVRPIFISSTFLDMQAERDALRAYVFPELEERLRGAGQHLEWIDLRIGVATVSLPSDEARENHVLKVCLGEAARCRPFHIVLLGDRYGWSASPQRAREAGVPEAVLGRSVTEIEIEIGILGDPQHSKALVYIRRPLPYTTMPPDLAARYVEADKQRADLLENLKRRLQQSLPGRVSTYPASWDGKNVVDLEAWARGVLEDIWREMRPPTVEKEPSWQELERRALEEFVADGVRDFVGREAICGDIVARLTAPGDGACGVCLVGPPGQGKSAVFAKVHEELLRAGHFILAHAPTAHTSSSSTESILRRWIGELAAALGEQESLPENAEPELIDKMFASHLARVAAKRRVIVMADSLDQLDPTPRARFGTWLPRFWPRRTGFFATSIPNETTESLSRRPDLYQVALPPLGQQEARDIIHSISARYGRSLEPQLIDAILAKRKGDQWAWGNPLWLSLAVEEINLVDADDFERALGSVGSGAEQVLRMLLELVQSFPTEVLDLYRATFRRAGSRFDTVSVLSFLALIAVSRSGLRETEFRALLPRLTGKPWDPLAFASLRHFFRGQTRLHRDRGQWDFAHQQMRVAVLAQLAANGIPEAQFHRWIGEHLLGLPSNDPLHVSETLWHLLQAEEWERAGDYYGDPNRTNSEIGGASDGFTSFVLSTENGPEQGAQTAKRILETPNIAAATNAAHHVLYRVLPDLKHRVDPEVEGILAEEVRMRFDFALKRSTHSSLLERDLGGAMAVLGSVAQRQGRSAEAIDYLSDAVTIGARYAEELGEEGARHLATTHHTRAVALSATGHRQEAYEAYKAAVALLEPLVKAKHVTEDLVLRISACRHGMAEELVALGRPQEAATLASKALAATEKAAGRNPYDQRSLSLAYSQKGNQLARNGDWDDAENYLSKSLAIIERLVASDPEDRNLRHDFIVVHEELGDLAIAKMDYAAARPHFDVTMAAAEREAKENPSDIQVQNALSIALGKQGNLALAVKQPREALRYYDQALAISKALADLDPRDRARARGLAVDYHRLGNAFAALGRANEARIQYETSLSLCRELLAEDAKDLGRRVDVANNLRKLAELDMKANRTQRARSVMRESLEVHQSIAKDAPDDPTSQFAVAVDMVLLADLGEATRSYLLEAREILYRIQAHLAPFQRGLLDYVERALTRIR